MAIGIAELAQRAQHIDEARVFVLVGDQHLIEQLLIQFGDTLAVFVEFTRQRAQQHVGLGAVLEDQAQAVVVQHPLK